MVFSRSGERRPGFHRALILQHCNRRLVHMRKNITVLFVVFALIVLFTACRQNLSPPTYRYRIGDTLPEGNGESVKVVLLSGQSNAAGCSFFEYLQDYPDIERLSHGFDNVLMNFYDAASDRTTNGFVPTDGHKGWINDCFGPELGIADALSSAFPEEKIFIIKFTYSGAALENCMAPGKGVFYFQLVKFIRKSLFYLQKKNYVPEIVGFCWMQGESDAMLAPDRYKANMTSLVTALRNDIARDLVIVDAAIADNPVYWVNPDVVNAAKRQLSEELADYVFIDTNAAGLTTDKEPVGNPDRAHYDALSELKLGHLFGEQILHFIINY